MQRQNTTTSDAPERFVIIGQGLAGSVLALRMAARGLRFRVVDELGGASSTAVALGLVNPIIGIRFSPQPHFDEVFALAEPFYIEAQQRLDARFWQRGEILRLFRDEAERARWHKRLASDNGPVAERYSQEVPAADCGPAILPQAAQWGGLRTTRGVARLDTRCFLQAVRAWLTAQGLLDERPWCHGETPPPGEMPIFCEGSFLRANPALADTPTQFAKGEVLTVRCRGMAAPFTDILQRGTMLVPHRGDGAADNALTFDIGATWDNRQRDLQPTAQGRDQLLDDARHVIGDQELEVLDHRAGLRPILGDKQPLVGSLNAGGTRVGVLNGLGSKGVLHAPRLADLLLDHLTEGQNIPAEMDVCRNFA